MVLSADALRIAIVAPPWYPLPPHGYGGTELVVHLLHNELRRLGHRVTVFGAEGSGPGVETLAPGAWSVDLGSPRQAIREATYLTRVYEVLEGKRFDVLHDHSGAVGTLAALHSGVARAVAHTIHGQLRDLDVEFYAGVQERVGLVAVSAAQAAGTGLRIAAVVHNAVDIQAARVQAAGEGYLVEIARICAEKGQHLAIEVARRTGRRLVLAGKIEPSPEGIAYFRERIEPHLGAQVEYLPNVAGREKAELIGKAAAGIFPLQWPEPFGLALAECMASGTPVLALACGSAPELVEDAVTGFLAQDEDELVSAVGRLREIDRVRCAAAARSRFSPQRMAAGYLQVYRELLAAAELAPALPLPAILDSNPPAAAAVEAS